MSSPVAVLRHLLFLAVFPVFPLYGQPKPAASPAGAPNFIEQVLTMENAFATEMSAGAVKDFDTAGARLREGYLKALAAARGAAAKLPDIVTAIETEEAATAAGKLPPPADEPATPPALKKLRATFRQAWITREKARDQKAAPIYSRWVKQLETIERNATKAGQTSFAAMIRARREQIAQEKPLTPASGFFPGSKPSPPPLVLAGKSGRWSTSREFVQWAIDHRVVSIFMEGEHKATLLWSPGSELPDGELTILKATFPVTDNTITARDLADMRDFSRLESITLNGPGPFTSAMVDALATLPGLTDLELQEVDPAPLTLAMLRKLKLKRLRLSSVTGLNGELLAQLPAGLTSLFLGAREWSGGLKGLSALKALETLDLSFISGLGAADLEPVAALPVNKLRLYNVKNLSASPGTMPALPKVTCLYVSGSPVVADVAPLVRALPSLTEVWCSGEDAAVAAAFAACPKLEELVLSSINKNCDKLNALAACSRLKTLRISNAAGGNALASVAAIKSLERLEFTSCADLGDEVAAAISSMESLNRLIVQICGISDSFLEPLKKMKTLRTLGIVSCPSVTPAAQKSLRKALQGCQFID